MTTVDQVIRRFESQLGVTESPFGSNYVLYNDWYYGRRVAGPWCATFLSWCFYLEGLPLPATTERGFAYTPSGANWFKQQGRWTTKPARGHVVFFDFPGDGVNRISHVGIVTIVNDNGSIQTVEGNTDESGSRTGGKVMKRTRSVGIVGYGIPDYKKVPQSVPQTTEVEEEMYIIWKGGTSVGALLIGSGKVMLTDGNTVKAFEAAGMKSVTLPEADFDRIPLAPGSTA